MQIYKNVLTSTTMSHVQRELSNFLETPNSIWACSSFKWSDSVKLIISCSTMMAELSPGLRGVVLEDLQDFLPPINQNQLSISYYVWTPNAGISLHDDGKYKFGATIYLNEFWDPNDGGIFLYQNSLDDWRAHVPTFNTMSVNTSGTYHMVTPVSPYAKQHRYTIQIFGDLKDE